MRDAHLLSQRLANLVKILGGAEANKGAMIKVLSHSSDISYQLLEGKMQSVDFFMTRKESYQGSTVYDTLKNRRMTMDQVLKGPIRDFSIPNFKQVSRKKSLNSPDDHLEKNVTETVSGESPWVTTTTTAAPNSGQTAATVKPPVLTTSTTSAPSNPGTFDVTGQTEAPQSADSSANDPEDFDWDWSRLYGLDNNIANPWFHKPHDISQFGDINKSKRSLHDPHTLSPHSHPHPYPVIRAIRTKRFVGAMIASLLTSIGIGSIFGAIDASQINTIRDSLTDTQSKVHLIVHEIEQNSESIMSNRNKLNGLEDLTKMLVKFTKVEHFNQDGQLVYILMNTEYARVHAALDEFTNIVEASMLHKFHPGILTRDGATSAFHEIQGLAKLRGLTPVIQTPQQLSQLETQFFFTPSGINLIVNIPLTSDQTTFTFFQFNPLPMQLSENVFLELVPKNQILAIGGSESNGHPRYAELSLLDISMCQKLGKVFICKDQRIISKPNSHSCLYALFEGLHEDARIACEIGLKGREQDQVVAIGADTFRYYSVTPSNYFLHCQNGSVIRGHQLAHITDIIIPENCRAETSSFILHRQSDIDHPVQPKPYKWTLPILDFLNNDTSIDTLEKAIETIENTPGAPPITKQTYEDYKRLKAPFYSNHYSNIILLVALFGLALGLSIVSFVVYKNCKENRLVKRRSNPTYQLRQLLENESNMEALEALLTQARVAN